MHYTSDIVIVGGGVVGLCAAIALQQRGFSVDVLDAGNFELVPLPDLRVYAINQASEAFLLSLGVWERLDTKHRSPYRRMHIWDGLSGTPLRFDARQVASDALGTIVEEAVIKAALLATIDTIAGVRLCPNQAIKTAPSITPNAISVSSGENTFQAKLLVIADGAQSVLRSVVGVSLNTWSYHQHALIARVQVEKPHAQVAYQVFNPEGTLAFLPLVNPNECSIVWSTNPAKAQKLMGLSQEAFNQNLIEAFGTQLGQCELISPRREFPLQMRHAKQYHGTRWLLMGDAAHTVHPLAGLGLNVGLADIRTLLRLMASPKDLPWSSRVQGRYQRERKSTVWQLIALLEALNVLFSQTHSPVIALRSLGLKVCDHVGVLKRFLIEQAEKH